MAEFLLLCLNLLLLPWLLLLGLLFGLMVTPAALAWHGLRGDGLAAAWRLNNALFGAFIIRGLWPLVRVRRRGLANLPHRGPCVIVLNHRSFADIFVCGLLPIGQIVVMVRSWPFRLWLVGRFMRAAGYIDLERMPLATLLEERGRALAARRCAFLFFPEGHRSRNGWLQRFRSGAFVLADELGLPIVPVCLSGTERIAAGRWPILHPARITLEVLPPLNPADYPEPQRAQRLKRETEARFRNYFGE